MKKVSLKNMNWLKQELPTWEESGVITPEIREHILLHYADQTIRPGGALWAMTIFSILGALLIGGGMILLFGHNWEYLSRNMRAVISFLPLVLASVLSTFVLLRNGKTVLREAAGLFHVLAVGGCIALIGQTYHLPSNVPEFFMRWILLSIPIVFLLSSTSACLVVLGLITGWAGIAQEEYRQAAGYWPLLLPALVFLVLRLREDSKSPATLLTLYGILFSLTISLGIVFERTVPGLWTMAYAALLTIFYLLGITHYANADGWANPLKLFGVIGIPLLAYLFTWTHFWDEIGWNYYRSQWGYQSWGAWTDGTFTFLLLGGWAVSAVGAFRKSQLDTLILSLFPILAVISFYVASTTDLADVINALIFNSYFLLLGILFVVQGCRSLKLRQLNGGMFLLSLLIITRFFDDEFGFLARGIAFILLGIFFLTSNLIIARKKKEVTA